MTEPTKEGLQHKFARIQVQWYLEIQRRTVTTGNFFRFKAPFIKEHKLENRFKGHSYDIVTEKEVIEIDDLQAHSKKSHKINDQIAEQYIKEYHKEYKFYRLLKEEIVDQHGRLLNSHDVTDYLRKNLF